MVRIGLVLLLLLLSGSVALAEPVDDLERDDSLALSIAWTLQTANARYCERVASSTGIQLEDAAVYDDPALARKTYGLAGDIYVGALAASGPGVSAGLSVNMTLAAISGHALAALPAPERHAPFTRLHQAQAMLDLAAERDGVVELTTADHHVFRVTAVPACAVSVKVDDEQNYANATRDEIRLGRRHLDLANGDTAVIAAMISHEMAHAVLDHQSQIAASRRSLPVIRRTEREADRLSVWLLANAGYPPEAALEFQRIVVAHFNGPLGIDPTHGNWRERSAIIEAEVAVLKSAPDADWRHRFRRETSE